MPNQARPSSPESWKSRRYLPLPGKKFPPINALFTAIKLLSELYGPTESQRGI